MFNSARILNTRMAGRNGRLTQLIREQGGDVVELPLLEAVHHGDPLEGMSWLEQFSPDGWIVVTSPTGAEALVRAGSAAKIACIGEATASVIRAAGLAIDFVPEQEDSSGFAREFIARYGAAVRVGLYRGSTASNVLPKLLRNAGVTVSERVAYTIRPLEVLNQRALEYFMEKPGAVVVSSPLGCERLLALTSGVFSITDVPLVTIGPTTTSRAGELGFRRILQAKRSSDPEIIEALREILRNTR